MSYTTGKDPLRNRLSRNPESVWRYYNDPRCTYRFTLNGYKALFETVFYVCWHEILNDAARKRPHMLRMCGRC